MNRNNKDKKQLKERFANLSDGEIAGIVIGVIAAFVVIVLVLMWLRRRSGSSLLGKMDPSALLSSATSSANPYLLTNTL